MTGDRRHGPQNVTGDPYDVRVQALRVRSEQLRNQLNHDLDHLPGPLCEEHAAFFDLMFQRLDRWDAMADKWTRRKPELDRALAEAQPVVAEFLDDVIALVSAVERGTDE